MAIEVGSKVRIAKHNAPDEDFPVDFYGKIATVFGVMQGKNMPVYIVEIGGLKLAYLPDEIDANWTPPVDVMKDAAESVLDYGIEG